MMAHFPVILWITFMSGAFASKLVADSSFSRNARIVGGSNAPEGGFPYQVSIRDSVANHTCGGAILSQTTVVTAAHCVKGKSPSRVTVVVGSNHLNYGGTRYGVTSVRSHPRYSSITLKNDIAVLKLATPVMFSSLIMAIEPARSNVGANVDAVLSGWGLINNDGPIPYWLQYIFMKTISVSECRRSFIFPTVDDSQICTLTRRGEGPCYGDRGSPLVTDGYLIGIVSWGNPCANGLPDVYTRVSYFNEWIIKNSY